MSGALQAINFNFCSICIILISVMMLLTFVENHSFKIINKAGKLANGFLNEFKNKI